MATPQSSSTPPSDNQPKIVHKLLVRTAIFLFVLLACFAILRWFQAQQGDYDWGGDSTGMIAAIRMERDGQQVVLIQPDGKIKGTSSWKPGVTDREPVWSPDGKFLYFCSDRKEQTFNIMRWNPQKDDAEARTTGRTSRSNPTFLPADAPDALDSLLMIAGGTVHQLDPKTQKTPQILPPPNPEITQSGAGDESGTEGSFSAIYGSLGNSFRIARYIRGERFVAAVMRRDVGEILVIQDLETKNGTVPKPIPVVTGDRIDFDIANNGTVVFTVQNFRWPDSGAVPPQYRKGNHFTTPFRNEIGALNVDGMQQIRIYATQDDKSAFMTPRITPDGSQVVVVEGPMEDGAIRPRKMMLMPCAPDGGQSGISLVQGEVYEPSFSRDGQQLIYAKRVGDKRDLYTIDRKGGTETNITKGQGDFSHPLFSPMQKK